MGAAPSIPKDDSRHVEVISAGLPRTGTLSMQVALETLLQGPVMHGGTHMFLRGDAWCRQLCQAYDLRRRGDKQAELKVLRAMFAGYAGVTDLPPASFLEELLELYPDARVVLVKRDPQKWWQSFHPIIENHSPMTGWILSPVPGLRWSYTIGNWFYDWWETVVGAPATVELMERHAAYVRRVVPRERLLEMELSQGWAPLCEFLGKPVPGVAFPRLNEAENRDAFFRGMMTKAALIWIGIFATAGVAGYAGWTWWLAKSRAW